MPIKTDYKLGQFCWVDLAAHDIDEAATFYGDFLGWTRERRDLPEGAPRYEMLTLDGRKIAGIGQMSADMISSGVPPTWNSYLNVEDVDAIAARSKGLGATVTVPPMDAADAGRLAFIQDPTGAIVGLWQKQLHFGSEQVGDAGCAYWNELQTRDSDAAQEFYGSLFGWQFEERTDDIVSHRLIHCDGSPNGSIVQMDERWGNMPPRWAVYFAVENADFAADQLRQLGGMVYVPPFDYPIGRTAMVGDIEGAMFNVLEPRD